MAPPLLPMPWTSPSAFIGVAYPVTRTPIWLTTEHKFQSGKRMRYQWWSYPQYRYTLTFNVLQLSTSDLQNLLAFFNLVGGSAGVFQFTDPDDCTATAAGFGIGNGSQTAFQLYRPFGGTLASWDDPVFAVSGSPQIFISGVSTGAYTLGPTGVVTFNSPPGSGTILTWTGSFNWFCRFDADTADFEKFLDGLYRTKQLSFTTEKLLQ
jgi:uncharacterized protein (TIGR02217 family)